MNSFSSTASSELVVTYQLEKCLIRIYSRILAVVCHSKFPNLVDVGLLSWLITWHTLFGLSSIDPHQPIAKQTTYRLFSFRALPPFRHMFKFALIGVEYNEHAVGVVFA